MVWEYQLKTIVMLTRCAEKGKVQSYSNITCILLICTSRLLRVQKNNDISTTIFTHSNLL